jgi:hypothetical protein
MTALGAPGVPLMIWPDALQGAATTARSKIAVLLSFRNFLCMCASLQSYRKIFYVKSQMMALISLKKSNSESRGQFACRMAETIFESHRKGGA